MIRFGILDLPVLCDPYKSSLFAVDQDNRIIAIFNYYDRIDQKDFIRKQFKKYGNEENKNLFLGLL